MRIVIHYLQTMQRWRALLNINANTLFSTSRTVGVIECSAFQRGPVITNFLQIVLQILPSKSTSSNPMADSQLIVLGPRKRKDTARFKDNGDPGPVSRNKKPKPASDACLDSTKKDVPKTQNLRAGDDANVTITAGQASPNTDVVDSGAEDSVENDDENPIEVDDDSLEDEVFEESAEEELGEC